MSRHGLASRRSRPRTMSRPGGRLPGRVATSARPACARDKPAVRAVAPTTWALRAQCARDLGSGCARSAPNPVLIQCTVCSHCLGNCSWTLFMNTVHREKKKRVQNF